MDLRSVLTWREEVEQALEKLISAVRPRPAPAPAPADRSSSGTHVFGEDPRHWTPTILPR
jgi:hypothetical protein